jgi:hypothetical protein
MRSAGASLLVIGLGAQFLARAPWRGLARIALRHWGAALVAWVVPSFGPATCSAGSIFDNFPGTYNGVAYASSTSWLAAKFSVDSQAYWLDSIRLDLDNQSPTPASGTIRLQLLASDDGGTTPLSDAGAAFPTTFVTTPSYIDTYVTFTPTAPFELAANTTYWAVLSEVGGFGDIGWTSSFSQPSGPAGVRGYNISGDAGATWVGFNPQANFKMQIVATAASVPEPGTFWLLGAGFTSFTAAFLRRRRRPDGYLGTSSSCRSSPP